MVALVRLRAFAGDLRSPPETSVLGSSSSSSSAASATGATLAFGAGLPAGAARPSAGLLGQMHIRRHMKKMTGVRITAARRKPGEEGERRGMGNEG